MSFFKCIVFCVTLWWSFALCFVFCVTLWWSFALCFVSLFGFRLHCVLCFVSLTLWWSFASAINVGIPSVGFTWLLAAPRLRDTQNNKKGQILKEKITPRIKGFRFIPKQELVVWNISKDLTRPCLGGLNKTCSLQHLSTFTNPVHPAFWISLNATNIILL